MSELSESDRRHLDAWADCGDGYTAERVFLLHCLWCEYTVKAPTYIEAVAIYKREHEGPILDRVKAELAKGEQ